MKRIVIFMILAALFLLVENAVAMRSANFFLDWYTPLTSGGGGLTSSANYAVTFTIGQTVIGTSSSPNYAAGLGYWSGMTGYRIYLPLLFRNHG